MAVVASSALYGTGVYGGSTHGTRNVSFTLTGVAGTSAIQTVAINGFEIDISERLGNVSATGAINTVTVNIQEDVTGVAATGAIGTLTFSNTVGLTGVSTTSAIGTLAISNTVGLTGVAATGAIEAVSAGGFEVDVSEVLASVSATGAVTAVQPTFSFTEQITTPTITASIGTVNSNVKEELGANATVGVSATGSINTVIVHTKENLLSTSATGSIGFASSNVIAVQFDFEAIKEDYSRRRTVILPRVA